MSTLSLALRLAIVAVASTSATVGALHAAEAVPAEAAGAARAIQPIVPHRRAGTQSCFAAKFSSRTIDAEDWSHVTHEVVPGVFVAGTPAIRPVPKALPARDVSKVAVLLIYDHRTVDTGEDFRFVASVTSTSFDGALLARGGCSWSGWDGERETEPAFMLGCGIDCDGGGMALRRVPGTGSLDLSFDDLSMQAGCDGGGTYRIGTSETSEKYVFRLERVPLSSCKPLATWSRRN